MKISKTRKKAEPQSNSVPVKRKARSPEKLVEKKPTPPKKMIERCQIKINDEEPSGDYDFECIDKILYINLAARTDRRKEMEDQFVKLNIPTEKIVRIEAISNSFGAIGCTSSHIKALQWAKDNNLKNVLILEDDFNFMIKHLRENLLQLKKVEFPWDVIMFSGNLIKIPLNYTKPFFKLERALTSSGYLVNGHYYDVIIENYKQGLENLVKTFDKKRYALDVWFRSLQARDKWYTFTHRCGYQRPSYSDIEKRLVNYCC